MYLNLSDARIFFDVVGPKLDLVGDQMIERPTLLVLHGGPGFDHTTLRPYFDRFADAFQVVYIDHRGCGRSGGGVSGWHLDQWADDIAAICAALGIEKPLVYGNSFGGMVAMHYAVRHPDGPARLILSSTAAQFRLDATQDMMRRLGGERAAQLARGFFMEPSIDGHEEYMQVCAPLYTQTDAPDAKDFMARAINRPEVGVHFFTNEMHDMDMRGAIRAIECPVLVMGGALDPVTPPICSEEIAKAIGDNATLLMFEGCGHGVHRDDPNGAEQAMRSFLGAD